MNQLFRDQLREWRKQNMNQIKKKRRRRKKRQSERLSETDIISLMGMNRPTYARGRGGAFRQR